MRYTEAILQKCFPSKKNVFLRRFFHEIWLSLFKSNLKSWAIKFNLKRNVFSNEQLKNFIFFKEEIKILFISCWDLFKSNTFWQFFLR